MLTAVLVGILVGFSIGMVYADWGWKKAAKLQVPVYSNDGVYMISKVF